MLWQRCGKVETPYNQYNMLQPRWDTTTSRLRRCSDLASILDCKFNLVCTRMLYWQRWRNVEIGTLNSQRLQNVNNATWVSRFTSVASTLDSKSSCRILWMLQYKRLYNVVTATSSSYRLRDVSIMTLHQRCGGFAKNVKYGLFMVAW